MSKCIAFLGTTVIVITGSLSIARGAASPPIGAALHTDSSVTAPGVVSAGVLIAISPSALPAPSVGVPYSASSAILGMRTGKTFRSSGTSMQTGEQM